MNPIIIGISPGEATDRITILSVKAAKIEDEEKKRQAMDELMALAQAMVEAGVADHEESHFAEVVGQELKEVHEKLWRAENFVRQCEAGRQFGPDFTRVARHIYKLNDKRARLKDSIDKQYGFRPEPKEYTPYGETKG